MTERETVTGCGWPAISEQVDAEAVESAARVLFDDEWRDALADVEDSDAD